MIQEWYNSYSAKTHDEVTKAKREIIQYITLAGLSRSDFFKKASYYGGTALRMLYGLPRFSEDIDFSLNEQDDSFTLENYFSYIEDECKMHDLMVDLTVKKKVNSNAVESAFLKDTTEWNVITFQDKKDRLDPELKVKIEIDRNPPTYFLTEQKLLIRPYSFYITAYREEYLFAGKMHALLFREWKSRIKGRDWYDFEWYVKRGTKLNLRHLQERAIQNNHLVKDTELTIDLFQDILEKKIKSLDIDNALFDIKRFVINQGELNIWSTQYFLDLAKMIMVDNEKS